MHTPIKSRWKIACWAFRPSALLAQSRLNEFMMQPGGSGETSGLIYDFRAFIHECTSGTYKKYRINWGQTSSLKHCISQMADAAFSSGLAVYHPFNATQLQKTFGQNTKVICFASFHWQRAQSCLHGWITAAWQWFCTMLHTLHMYSLHTWKHPAAWEFGLQASTFHTAFYQELIMLREMGEKSIIKK